MRLGIALALTALGCGSHAFSDVSSCSITLSGAATGASWCTSSGLYNAVSGVSSVAVTTTLSGLSISVNFPGSMHVGTFKNTDPGANTAITFAAPATANAWTATTAGGSAQGSYTLTLTSTGTGMVSGIGNDSFPDVHGTLNATLDAVAGTGSTGAVTLAATF